MPSYDINDTVKYKRHEYHARILNINKYVVRKIENLRGKIYYNIEHIETGLMIYTVSEENLILIQKVVYGK